MEPCLPCITTAGWLVLATSLVFTYIVGIAAGVMLTNYGNSGK